MKLFIRELGKAFFVGVLIFIVIGVIQYLNGVRYTDGKELLIHFGYNQLYSVVLYMANALYIIYLLRLYKEKLFKINNLSKGILGAIIITIVCLFFLRLFKEVVIDGETLSEFISGEKIQYYYISFIISAVVTAIFYAFYYYRYTQGAKSERAKDHCRYGICKIRCVKEPIGPTLFV